MKSEEVKTKKLNTQKYSLRHKWDFRTGSPHRVFRAIYDVFEELGYVIQSQSSKSLELKPLPITDTATFEAEIKGEKTMSGRYYWWLALLGGLFIFVGSLFIFEAFIFGARLLGVGGIFLLFLGIILVGSAREKCKQILLVKIEGEAYKVKADVKAIEAAETTDVIADTRIVASISVIQYVGDSVEGLEEMMDEEEIVKLKGADKKILEEDFDKLRRKIEAILPSFMKKEPFN